MELWQGLMDLLDKDYVTAPKPGLRMAVMDFRRPILLERRLVGCCCDLLVLAFMTLLYKYAYHTVSSYGVFSMGYAIKKPRVDIIIGSSITFREEGKELPVYHLVDQQVRSPDLNVIVDQVCMMLEFIDDVEITCPDDLEPCELTGLYIRINHFDNIIKSNTEQGGNDTIANKIWECINGPVVKDYLERNEWNSYYIDNISDLGRRISKLEDQLAINTSEIENLKNATKVQHAKKRTPKPS